MQPCFRYGLGHRCVCLAGLRGFVTRRLPQMPSWSSLPMTQPCRFPVASEPTLHKLAVFMHRPHFCTVGRSFVGVGAAWRLRGPAAAMRASAGAVSSLLRGAPRLTTAGRRGAGCFMAVDCRTDVGGDVVTAARTPRTAAASRRQCLETSSPRWRRDKARQDEATRPGD